MALQAQLLATAATTFIFVIRTIMINSKYLKFLLALFFSLPLFFIATVSHAQAWKPICIEGGGQGVHNGTWQKLASPGAGGGTWKPLGACGAPGISISPWTDGMEVFHGDSFTFPVGVTFTVQNTGTTLLTISNVSLTRISGFGYTSLYPEYNYCNGMSLAPSGTCTFLVGWRSFWWVGTYSEQLKLQVNSNAGNPSIVVNSYYDKGGHS